MVRCPFVRRPNEMKVSGCRGNSCLLKAQNSGRLGTRSGCVVNRIEQRFSANQSAGRRGLLPYFTSGYPDLATCAELIRRADALGVTAIEIGIPYSDSIADGSVIQESFHYVLGRGQRLAATFALVEKVRASVECALIAMVSYSLVHRFGAAAFMMRAASVGFDGIILPDLPVEEASAARSDAGRANLCHIGLVAPTTRPDRRDAIARASSGFLYQIAVAGTTGERQSLSATLADDVIQLRALSGLPVCVGFGISTADHVRQVCAVADGAIVGSAIIRRLADGIVQGEQCEALLDPVEAYLAELMSGVEGRTG